MSKYIDLEPTIRDFYGTELGTARRAGMCDALRYLDTHPGETPGRTITLTTLVDAYDSAEVPTESSPTQQWDLYISRLERLSSHDNGLYVALTGNRGTHMGFDHRILSRRPEPTNAEKLERLLLDLELVSDPAERKRAAQALADEGVKAGGKDE